MLAQKYAPAVEERVDVVVAEALRHVRDGRPNMAIETLSTSKATTGNAFACNLLGLLHTTLGQNQNALESFERCLRLGGRSPEILRNCAIALQRLGRFDAAIARYDDGLALIPGDLDLAYRRGTALHLAGRLEAAAQSYETVLRSDPHHAEALANRGSALQEIGRLEEALACYDRAVAAQPQEVSTWVNRGNLLRALKRPEDGLASFEAALRLRPGHVAALQGCALLLQDMAAFDAALACCKAALEQAPRSVPLLQLEGNILCAAGRRQEALAAFDAALAIEPSDPVLLCNRAAVLCELHRFAEALVASDAAISLSPHLPEAWTNRGSALLRLYRLEAALAAFDEACRLRPGYPEALSNRGVVLRELSRFAEALAAFDACLAASPGFPHALNGKSVTLLLLGDFEEGWKGYGGRVSRPVAGGTRKAWPEWPGLPLARSGLRLLVADEHGLGDAIHFARYLPLLKATGVDLTVLCRRSLQRLLQPLLNGLRVVDTLSRDEDFDYLIGLTGLPRAFQTNLDSIPGGTPYLAAEADRAAHWASILGDTGFRIGIGWQCNMDLRGEDSARAMPLTCFAALAALPGVRLVSLQKGAGVEQLDASLPMPVETLAGLDEGADAFLDTAAVMQSLDLVVTCDTSLAHLAGALGRPVWVALRHVPEWRWLLDRDDSPWYPTMRLFRQSRVGDWEGVFARMAMALREHMAACRQQETSGRE